MREKYALFSFHNVLKSRAKMELQLRGVQEFSIVMEMAEGLISLGAIPLDPRQG